ncbi:ribonuclease R family protein [Vacuolonema iberomarrocanum]|uniref:ribonuclease R family protein n=1 Tax=Vacuolonema iberomarrocanum TaxID=3454632 RepID=UPI001A0CEBE6|nr:VacB/RNase II family 3'-5' exoribonuclease [filamentous cyanobacterium LEGE 07170]
MKFSIASLFSNFQDDKLVAPKVLEKKLECEDEDSIRRLHIALDALERIGLLVKERGKYKRVSEDDVVEGKLRCSSKGFCFAIQDEEGAEDIYVRESQLNTAWNGDRVLVRVTKEGSRRRSPEGEVRLILERSNSSVLARVKHLENKAYRAVPLDDRLLFELDLLPSDDPPLDDAVEQLVHVEIVRYPLGQHLPVGRVAQVLGLNAQEASDINIVCCKHDLPRHFSDEVIAAAKELPTKLRKTDLKKRLDLRDVPTITIDGPDHPHSPAIDDAVSLEELKGGLWRLGIHIADVSYYVTPRSPIDQEAQKRGTSIFLGEVVIPMMPEQLHKICSLLPGEDRLAMSILVTLNADAEVQEYEIQPSVIQVNHALGYQQAQAIIKRDHPEVPTDSPYPLPSLEELKHLEPVFDLVDQLYDISQAVSQQRQQRGAFDLNLPESIFPEEHNPELGKFISNRFQYDDEGELGAMVVSSVLPARSIVTELMLLANQLIADHLKALQIPAIYRQHRTPDPEDVQELVKLVANMGIDYASEAEDEVHPRDYQNLTRRFAESESERVLTYLLLETLKPAVYSNTPGTHFGLALENAYTHFTSPLRRYPDLLIHRLLHTVFEHGRNRKTTRSKEKVNLHSSSCHDAISWTVLPPDLHEELTEQFDSLVTPLTEQERLAQEAEDDLEGLKKAEYMQERTGETFHGIITGVQSYGFFVEIEELLVEGLVHVSSLKDDWYEFRSRQQKLVGRKNRQQFRLGDRVEVQVKSVDYYRQQIDLLAVGGGSEATDDDEDDFEPVIDEDTDNETDEDAEE